MTEQSVTVILDGISHTVRTEHPNFTAIKSAIKASDWDSLPDLVDIKKAFIKFSQGHYTIEDDQVLYKGEPIPDCIARRVLGFFNEEISFEFLLKFHERLQANPSRRAVQELYSFLEHRNIPIGDDGCFYAYKSVRSDWMSWSACRKTGERTLNTVGSKPNMPRNEVDDDPSRGCSYGYHVGSLTYASTFGWGDKRLLIVKVDPANVVSVPHDCAHQKIRCSGYEVFSEYEGDLPENHWSGSWDEPDCNGEEAGEDDTANEIWDQIAEIENQWNAAEAEAAEEVETIRDIITRLKSSVKPTEKMPHALEAGVRSLEQTIQEIEERVASQSKALTEQLDELYDQVSEL